MESLADFMLPADREDAHDALQGLGADRSRSGARGLSGRKPVEPEEVVGDVEYLGGRVACLRS